METQSWLISFMTNRLARSGKDLWQGAVDEVNWLEGFVPEVWSWLMMLFDVDYPALRLRHEVIYCAYRSLAYSFQNVFCILDGFPWCLCWGDVDQNLEAFAGNADECSDPVAAKFHKLCDMGYPRWKLKMCCDATERK